ncbi:hypothetical protein [Deinococcus hohokamensis]|uniref:Outer membrane protein beta-barrel domain-containing protein n=1 Tax=Deinococcus hohokamensis TaxID=309883 RepID=A0ABV9IFL7_9DEIO
MKKVLLSVLALSALSSASASERIGAYLLGLQYERDVNATDSVRYGVGLPVALGFGGGGVLALSGDVSYLRHVAPASQVVQPYFGGSLGLVGIFGTSEGTSAAGVVLFPNVLGGLNFNVSNSLSLFTEAGVGPRVIFAGASDGTSSAGGTDVSLGFGVRVGLNYTVR